MHFKNIWIAYVILSAFGFFRSCCTKDMTYALLDFKDFVCHWIMFNSPKLDFNIEFDICIACFLHIAYVKQVCRYL